MKIHTNPSTFNDYYNEIVDANSMSHEQDPIQASAKHEHIYHIPEQWGEGVHRTHFLRKGFELSHSQMLFHEPVQIARRFDTPYLELALNLDYSASWSIDGFRSDREHGGHVQLIYMNEVEIQVEMPGNKAMNHIELRFNPS